MKQPLVVDNVHKRFAEHHAVRGISFDVKPGEVIGIIGPNGAGKTTTIKMILGLLQPDEGSIRLFGEDGLRIDLRKRIGYMPETPSFYSHLTGKELLGFVGSLFELSGKETEARSTRLLEKVGLSEAADRALGGYSKGMLQRIGLAQALMNEPELLFLDEPLDGLDPIGRIRMKETLLEIKKNGTAIVLNSHILSDVEVMSDRIAIMDKGELVAFDKVGTLIPKSKSLEEVFIKAVEAHSAA